MVNTVELLKELLAIVNSQKTGERSEEQRRIAILATKVEDALSWAHYTWDAQLDQDEEPTLPAELL